MQQKRLILALLLSSAILFLWTVFYPAKPPENQNNQANTAASPSPVSTATPSPDTGNQLSAPAVGPSTVAPQRTLTIRTPLYEAKFDSRGAEPVSWIVKKNKRTGVDIWSSASTRSKREPLELISPEGLRRQPRQVPMQVITGNSALDVAMSSSTYAIEGVPISTGDAVLDLSPGQKQKVTFVLENANGVTVRKTVEFDADRYDTDVALLVKRGTETVPQVKLTVGPSIGDQGIRYYTMYLVAPEAIGFVNGKIERHAAAAINGNSQSPDHLSLNGPVDWAGVSDTYFGMVAVPERGTEGLEYRTTAYEHQANGKPEKRYLITALVPVPSDGSRTVIYSGPKDHYLLTEASEGISKKVQHPGPIDLDGLIDYGWFAWLSRPLALPILQAITYLHRVTGSYGVAIMLFTIGVYSLFFPLKWRSSKAMKKAQKMAPQMKELQEKMKGLKQNDPRLKELQMEQLRLMKEGNPLGGCLPLLIQMPFLFALFRAITISVDFRHATFLWLPDLSGGDPYHVLEFSMVGTMVILQLITPAPSADPLQRKMMAIGMPIFMLYVLWGAPAGLLVYWLVGNIVGFLQQFVINRWTKTEDGAAPPPGKGGKATAKRKAS